MNSGLLVFQPQTFSADYSPSFPPHIQTMSKLQIRNFTFPWLPFFFYSRPPGLFRRLPPKRQPCLHPCPLQGPHIFFRHKPKPDRWCHPLLRTLPQLRGARRESPEVTLWPRAPPGAGGGPLRPAPSRARPAPSSPATPPPGPPSPSSRGPGSVARGFTLCALTFFPI